jgi:hypothetical protein
MAQTDARAGFRLPWSSDRQPSETLDGDSTTETQVAATTGWPGEDTAGSTETAAPTENATDAETTVTATQMADPWATPSPVAAEPAPAPSAPTPPPARKPTRFMADLTKAMQAAAEDARSRALTQLQTDAKSYVESIHGRSSTEAAGLRRAADDDVAAVREWSKAEIARVREETEAKITARKGRLESEIEQHAGVIEREIDAVQKTVAAFEDEMAAFFERLLGEEDPSRFATMAENLPEAPSFEGIVATPVDEMPEAVTEPETMETEPVAEVEVEAVAETETEAVAETAETEAVGEVESIAEDVVEAGAADTTETTENTETDEVDASGETSTNEVETATDADGESSFGSVEGADGDESGDGEIDREAAFAAIQAAAEAAASAEVAADAAARAEAVADVAIEIMGNHEDEEEADPRFAALGLSPDYDAAEAEALLAAGSSTEEIPEIDDDALAARIAGLVPGKNKGETADSAMTQVVVVGLVSVASIASFKRHLGRVSGVQSVGVSSGPDGEFVFAVKHAGDAVLRDAIPSLPSFQARVTGSSDGVVHVTAHDPEGDA